MNTDLPNRYTQFTTTITTGPNSKVERESWPLDWARCGGNVVVGNVHDSGGHFAGMESPILLLRDIRAFWGNATLSNVGVFAK